MTSGRNAPLLLHVRDETDRPEQCIVKSRSRLATPPLEYLLEWLGAALARALGLTTPEPLAVSISDDFAQSVDPSLREELVSSIGLVYGSRFVRGVTQVAQDYPFTASQREIAASILAFDVFIHNRDRRASNKNLFIDRNDLVVFDHELAFDFVHALIGAPDPVLDHCPDLVAGHALYAPLRGKAPKQDGFRARLESLDQAFFEALMEATPSEWTCDHARGKLDRIVEVLQRRREAVDRWLPKVFACLDR